MKVNGGDLIMLNSKRYITRGIQETLNPLLQFYIWDMLGERISQMGEIDYLQVFHLNPLEMNQQVLQQIKYTQEVPERSKTILLRISNSIKNKVFIIQSQNETGENYWAMFLAEILVFF